jgi:1-acyl-sn-glycerol-3-phosphate acyltransferase
MLMRIRCYIWTLYAALTTIIGTTAVFLCAPFPYRVRLWVTRVWCDGMLLMGRLICGIKLEVEGMENLPDEPSVLMIKHSSLFETYTQATIFPLSVWVLKKEILRAPVFGWGVALLKPIAIDRSSGHSAVVQVIEQGMERLSEGTWVTIFPEGTRMLPGTTRLYGVSGAALAEKAGCPIVPVAHNAADIWPRAFYPKRPGTVRMVVGPPVDPTKQPPKETNLIVQGWIESKMREISTGYRSIGEGAKDQSAPASRT